MRIFQHAVPLFVAGFLASTADPAVAQARAPLARADVTGIVAVLGVEDEAVRPYVDNDWHSSFFGGLGAGWYWTDHFKTEMDFGAGTESRVYRATPIAIGASSSFVTTESRVSQRTLGISQQYQFFRNVWFHPFVGGGIDFTWESAERYDEVYSSFLTPGGNRVEHPERQEFHTRPFATLGFKAYMTPHGFFRTDLKFVANSHGLDEVMLRFGFGVDF